MAIQSSKMKYSGGIHEKILYWFYNLTWAIQEEFTREYCDNSIVQQELFIQEFTLECWKYSTGEHQPFSRSSRENVVMIPYVYDLSLYRIQIFSNLGTFWMIYCWIGLRFSQHWKEFTWECYGDSILLMSHLGGVHDRMMWGFHSLTWAIHSRGAYVRMMWWFHSATWAIWKEFT